MASMAICGPAEWWRYPPPSHPHHKGGLDGHKCQFEGKDFLLMPLRHVVPILAVTCHKRPITDRYCYRKVGERGTC